MNHNVTSNDPAAADPDPLPTSAPIPAPCSSMARAALWLSIVSFILPLGIAAIVLGHVAEHRIESSRGALNGKATARAALWIAYIQIALISLAAVVVGGLFQETAQGFRRDALVQRFFRAHDSQQPLDADSAREAELTARTLAYQLIAIEDESSRYSKEGLYICQLNQVLYTGLQGATDAEKTALAARVADSPYRFEITSCNPAPEGEVTPRYTLTAVPRAPRMPEGSAVFCADQSGVLRSARGGTSIDCLKSGEPVSGN